MLYSSGACLHTYLLYPLRKEIRSKGTKNALDAQYQPLCPLKLLLLTLACYPLLPCEEPTNTYYIIMYKDEL